MGHRDESIAGDSEAHAQSRRDMIRRDCAHPGTPHVHGTRAAYVSDRCGCTRCRAANRAAEQRRTTAIALGRWAPYVDSQPARDQLLMIRKDGLGVDRMAQLSGVPRSTIKRMLNSNPAARPKRIRSNTARRLLALQGTAERVSPRRQVDSESTQTSASVEVPYACLVGEHSSRGRPP